jgi:glycosyltransferase involved in cell wall biosynthesis
VAALLEEADLCVFPSRFDNFPNTCLEAMGAGRAIVATCSGGMEEMLLPARGGMLVKPGSHVALAEAIVWMLEHHGEKTEMARRARSRVQEAYGDDVLGPLYEKLYTDAVETKKSTQMRADTKAMSVPKGPYDRRRQEERAAAARLC